MVSVLLPATLPVLRMTNNLKLATSPAVVSPAVVSRLNVPGDAVPTTVAVPAS